MMHNIYVLSMFKMFDSLVSPDHPCWRIQLKIVPSDSFALLSYPKKGQAVIKRKYRFWEIWLPHALIYT